MKFSVNWLREFVDLPESIDDLAETLTLAGVEIEGIGNRGADFDKVIISQITASAQHPNADRLSVCRVDDGSGHPREIVCGAKNYKVGDKVPLALPGAVLPGDLKIKASKLRGVESQGMLCSAKELGVADDAAGLLILSPDAKVGAPIGSLFPADTVLDVEITPNRPDLLSHLGLAREIAALTGKRVTPPKIDQQINVSAEGVAITATHECPFYSARRLENVHVGPSPDWLRGKIEAAGIRSINNVVDVTNYVMLELGQPLHAFDADKLRGPINVRLANEGEKFLALDGRTYVLTPQDLVIGDAERAVAIAGVMGGEETGVTETTRNVLLEAAYFLPSSVRRTARALQLPSDSSYRFERGVDPGMVEIASTRAAQLINALADARLTPTISEAGKLPQNPTDVRLRYARLDLVAGVPINPERADDILAHFGLTKTEKSNPAESTWRIPSFRRDLQREEDIIEEVIRVFGINRIDGTDRSRFTPASAADRAYDAEARLRQRLVARGLSEVRTSTLVPRESIDSGFGAGALELRNPLSEDHVALRPSLLTGLLQSVGRNLRAGAESLRLFELGRVFATTDAAEHRRLAVVFCGNADSELHWRAAAKRRLDFFDLKGAVESLSPRISFRRSRHTDLALAVELRVGDSVIGFAGQLGGALAANLGTTAPVYVAELELAEIIASAGDGTKFADLEKFPAIKRDIALIVPESLTHEQIYGVMLGEPLVQSVKFFDQLIGKEAAEKFGSERKSLAYSLTYRAKDRTLTNDEVTVVHTRIRDRLKSELGAELRE